MENLNDHFKDSKVISEKIAKEFQRINTDAHQRLEELNKRVQLVSNQSLEQAIITSSEDAIQTSKTEQVLQEFMKNLDISTINQETIENIESGYQNQKEQKMSAEEISQFVDEEHFKSKENQEIVAKAMLDERIIKLCKEKSVKPKTKIKKKAKKRHLNVAGFILASSLAISTIATPVVAHAINTAYPNQMIEEATENYMENIFNPNTEQFYNQEKEDTDHYHDLIDIMTETKEEYENPIVGFYLVYNNLDKYCKNHKLEAIFYNFNLIYNTDYTSLDDFLQKNNFKNKKEFEEYVGYELSKLSIEERGRGL